ncbi:hypothetical protein Y1Q_0009391 [Alligator mississippiensis]|uniref:Uncharacterized protein n=1 Tax=Alligator mississippiensis TaxID=8496 RepID=A0A151N7L6_ALLMI|nr:hypothetical protein Y1Q_0009391 [Alligator mississippiensis]
MVFCQIPNCGAVLGTHIGCIVGAGLQPGCWQTPKPGCAHLFQTNWIFIYSCVNPKRNVMDVGQRTDSHPSFEWVSH